MLCGLSRETPGEAGKSWGPVGRVMGLNPPGLLLPGRRLGRPLPRDPKPGGRAGPDTWLWGARGRTVCPTRLPSCSPAAGAESTRLPRRPAQQGRGGSGVAEGGTRPLRGASQRHVLPGHGHGHGHELAGVSSLPRHVRAKAELRLVWRERLSQVGGWTWWQAAGALAQGLVGERRGSGSAVGQVSCSSHIPGWDWLGPVGGALEQAWLLHLSLWLPVSPASSCWAASPCPTSLSRATSRSSFIGYPGATPVIPSHTQHTLMVPP